MSDFVTNDTEKFFNRWLFIVTAVVGYFIPYILHATTTPTPNPIATVVCNVVTQLTGPIGQAVSTVAVIFIGIGLFMGKISWGLALGIAIGMALLFGAESIVGWIGGNTITCTGGQVI
ncbi:MAG: TrbC/VirB2 family protein [Rickettsiaceae bacterium H1]|nr:TrbC/VirB2 family protein [Rickettsiaceae bacterium H1]